MAIECITANLDFATPPAKDFEHIKHLAELHPRVPDKLMFFQEAKNLRGGNTLARLGARLSGEDDFKKAWQDASSPSRAGTGFMTFGDAELRGFHLWSLGASGATLIRWTAHGWTPVPVLGHPEETGHLTAFSPHDFPHRSGPEAQNRYLRRMKDHTDHVHRKGNGWIVGTDANMPLYRVAKYLHGNMYGEGTPGGGIVGFVTSKNLVVSHHWIDHYGVHHGLTDHPAVGLRVEGIRP